VEKKAFLEKSFILLKVKKKDNLDGFKDWGQAIKNFFLKFKITM